MSHRRIILVTSLILLLSFIGPLGSSEVILDSQDFSLSLAPPSIQEDRIQKGVVYIDDVHSNDYGNGNLDQIKPQLEELGYIVAYASEFSTFTEGLNYSDYFLMTAPLESVPVEDISAIGEWLATGSKNILLASRGDFSVSNGLDFASMNSILTEAGVSIRAQDDNVYTTDSSVFRPWYIRTNNFNASFSELFEGVTVVDYFSPSSVSYGEESSVLMFAEDHAYQSDEGGDPPAVVYDDTDDNNGGSVIPLAVYEETQIGDELDRVVVVGTALWSDFDYSDSDAQDTTFIHNLMDFFYEKTLEEQGEIVITLPDGDAPDAYILSPKANSIVKGTVSIEIEAFDAYDIASIELSIDGTVVTLTENVYEWDTTTLSDGPYVVELTVKDTSDNVKVVTATYFVNQDYVATFASQIKVMTYNIEESGVVPEWLDVMKEENPDVVMLVETGNFDDNSNEQLVEVVDTLNSYFIDELPYESYTLQNIPNAWNGITLLSRFEIKSNEKISTLTSDSGSSIGVPLPFLHSVIDVNGTDYHVIGAHLTCCDDGKDERLEQQEGIINYMDDLGDVPIIYLGDMNAESPDDTTEDESDLGVEPIQMILGDHTFSSTVHTFVDVHIELNSNNNDPGVTYPGTGSRIDYIFVNQYFADKLLNSTTGDTSSANGASDHLPVDVFIDINGIPSTSETTTSLSSEESEETPGSPLNFAYFAGIIALFTLSKISRKVKHDT